MPPKSVSQRKAEERARKRSEGLKPREVWVRDKDWPRVQRYIERVSKSSAHNHSPVSIKT